MKKIKIVLVLFILFLLTGCNKTQMYKNSMFYMDTYIEVKLYDINEEKSKELFSKVDSMYKEYDMLSDRYTSYDDVINVYYLNNELKNNEQIEIDTKLSELINYGLNVYDDTNGYINIALGNVIDVWKKYRECECGVPTLDELSKENINIDDINLSDNIYSKKNNISIDLGAYAKGYVTQLVGEFLEKEGINKYLINAGGNVKVGKSYKKDKYSVGLETPFDTSKVYKILKVENSSIVTSGSYQRYYEYDNVLYNHIINPITLFPDNYTESVSIITNDSAKADILSTYLFMLSIDEGIELINSMDDVEAIWYSDDIYYSKGFNKYE